MSNHAPEVFSRVLDSEPDFALDISPALAEGARKRRQHRILGAGTAASTLALAGVVGAAVLSSSPTAAPSSPLSSPNRLTQVASLTSVSAVEKPQGYAGAPDPALVASIKSHSPAGFTFSFEGHRSRELTVDGEAADASGAGSFFLGVGPQKIGQTPFPCDPSEGPAGINCSESDVAGFHLVSREFTPAASAGPTERQIRKTGTYPMTSVDVSVSLPDGRTVVASSANYTVADLSEAVTKAGGNGTNPVPVANFTIDSSRATPTFTMAQLTSLAIAIAQEQFK